MPFLILPIFSVSIVLFLRYKVAHYINDMHSTRVAMPEEAVYFYTSLLSILNIASGCLVLLGVLTVTLFLMESHKVLGPLVAIRRQLEQLSLGNYQERIHIRTHDEWQDMARHLNRLAEILKDAKPS